MSVAIMEAYEAAGERTRRPALGMAQVPAEESRRCCSALTDCGGVISWFSATAREPSAQSCCVLCQLLFGSPAHFRPRDAAIVTIIRRSGRRIVTTGRRKKAAVRI